MRGTAIKQEPRDRIEMYCAGSLEHFDWLEPLFNERLETKHGRMLVPDRPGLGISLREQARAWTTESVEFGK